MKKKGISIKTGVVISTVIFMGILTTAIASIGYKLYYDSVLESYINYADTVLEYACRKAKQYSFGDMITNREMPEGYEAFREELNEIKDSSDIEYLYAIYFDDIEDIHSLHYAINAKNRKELSVNKLVSEIYTFMGKPVEAGGFEDDTLRILQKAVKDKKENTGTLTGYSDVYGHMLNGYHVMFDKSGNAAGLLCVEIDINRINAGLQKYVRIVILTASILTVLIILLFVFYAERYLTGPVMRIIKSSTAFVEDLRRGTEPEKLVYADTKVSPRGDIGMLAANVKSLADGVTSYMINLRDTTAEKERIGTELNVATKIQAEMLPIIFPPFPDRNEIDIFASMTPAKEVGGDFYDFFMVDERHIAVVAADVSGKGVPAALFMVIGKTLIKDHTQPGADPAEIFMKVNNLLCEANGEELFITAFLGILDLVTGELKCVSAGHEPPYIYHDGKWTEHKIKKAFVLAGMEDMKYTTVTLQLEPGDKLFQYTDGVTEATDAHEQLYGDARLDAALNRIGNVPARELCAGVKADIDAFVGEAPQFDDITMICLEYKARMKA